MTSDDAATLMRHLERCLERFERGVDRFERGLDRFERGLDRLPDQEPEFDLVAELAAVFEKGCFTAADVWRLARVRAEGAAAEGLPEPDLSRALAVSRIETAHGLGRWIADREGIFFAREGVERNGVQWSCLDEPAVSPDETA